jgi:hypothetical protein
MKEYFWLKALHVINHLDQQNIYTFNNIHVTISSFRLNGCLFFSNYSSVESSHIILIWQNSCIVKASKEKSRKMGFRIKDIKIWSRWAPVIIWNSVAKIFGFCKFFRISFCRNYISLISYYFTDLAEI